jgi:hypothetical protein
LILFSLKKHFQPEVILSFGNRLKSQRTAQGINEWAYLPVLIFLSRVERAVIQISEIAKF